MNKVSGRVSDIIVLSNGRRIHGEYFTNIFYDLVKDVKQFQVHQRSLSEIDVRMVIGEEARREYVLRTLNARFNEYTQGKARFQYYFMNAIDKEQSGKYRFVKSDVSL